MPINKQSYQIQGMRQDNLVGTGYSSKFAHEIMNMRFNTVGDYTTAVWTTEKGTKQETVRGDNIPRDFQPVGQATINDQWILFGIAEDGDYIFKLEYRNAVLKSQRLYPAEPDKPHILNFHTNNPLETLSYYENDYIQKVYWTDNLNQPRVINVVRETAYPNNWQFDFIKNVGLSEQITVTKQQDGAGQFPPCTVKYAITYFNKYGQESNIIWTSDLQYPTKNSRGLKEEELSGDTFVITVNNVDTTHTFDYIRLYSILRTTDDSTPIVRIVEDRKLETLQNNKVIFQDSNTKGEIIDPTIIQYLGGIEITAETFDQKDNTLFLGNITLKTKALKDVSFSSSDPWNKESPEIGFTSLRTGNYYKNIQTTNNSGLYPWVNQLDFKASLTAPTISTGTLDSMKVFKANEYYRFGVQCQDLKGNWSDVIFLGDFKNYTYPVTDEQFTQFSVFQYILPQATAQRLYYLGYRKARLVCCYPSNMDRSVLAQGALCPSLYNKKWQEGHAPDVFSSWFYRFGPIGNNTSISKAEVQSIVDSQEYYRLFKRYDGPSNTDLTTGYDIERGHSSFYNGIPQVKDEASKFFVNKEVLTFHSPDIEFDESIRTLDWTNIKMRIVGQTSKTSVTNKVFLEAKNVATDFNGFKGQGFNNLTRIKMYGESPVLPWAMTPYNQEIYAPKPNEVPVWNDLNVYAGNFVKAASGDVSQTHAVTFDYTLFPFQRKYLNNYMGDCTIPIVVDRHSDTKYTIKESSIIYNKIWATLSHANTTIYNLTNDVALNDCQVFDSNEPIPLKLNSGKIYMGNLNTIAPVETNLHIRIAIQLNQGLYEAEHSKDIGYGDSTYKGNETTLRGNAQESETVYTGEKQTINTFQGCYLTDYYTVPGRDHGLFTGTSADPVPITFKSTAHGVVELTEPLTAVPSENSVLIAELYRDVPASQRFGGTSEDALLNNQFLPCGKSVSLENITKDLILVGDIGDTYYMRYDNLKTYPYTREDINQVVEIFSFMCETRINLDGRSDRNRGLIDNTLIDNTNFNYINQSYTQKDNLFTYHILDSLESRLNTLPNQLTWTKTKTPTEDIDTWTNITLASVADADGTIGEITKVSNWRNNLLLFQSHGIAQIGYNEKTAISTANGVPLELANSGKYTGLNYLSKEIGCQNKWSISLSKNGVFFIDDSRQELLTIGENFPSISTLQGFDALMIQQLPMTFNKWNPENFGNFVTYYDKLSNDIYFINKNVCLAWNEQLSAFSSFYNYEEVPYITNIGNHSLMWKNGIWAARENTAYSTFFNNTKDYWMTIVCDGQTDRGSAFPADKVFNNIEYRADCFNPDGIGSTINEPIFNTKAAWNGYQMYKEFDIDAVRKFNTWRVQLPRATYNINGNLTTTRDRIRNPFCYIKLKQDQSITQQTNRMILHDLSVYFDMK